MKAYERMIKQSRILELENTREAFLKRSYFLKTEDDRLMKRLNEIMADEENKTKFKPDDLEEAKALAGRSFELQKQHKPLNDDVLAVVIEGNAILEELGQTLEEVQNEVHLSMCTVRVVDGRSLQPKDA